MFSKTLLLALVCARAASAADINVTAKGRGFLIFDGTNTDEPIDYKYPDGDDDGGVTFRVSPFGRVRNVTNSSKPRISADALLFLTGPGSTVVIPSFYLMVFLISVPINVCALPAFIRGIRPKKPAAIYMLNLAFADLLFAALLPFKIAYHFGGNDWTFGSSVCRVVTAAFYCNMYCSVLLIACISVDRLLAVVYPIDSLAWRRPKNSVIACVTMWVLSFAASVPLVLPEQTYYLSELNITTCHDVQSSTNITFYRTYFIALCCVLFFLPLLITVVSYTRVIWTLGRVPLGVPGRSRRRTRALVMAVTVLMIFVLCFTPTNCLLLAHYLQFNEGMKNEEAPDGSYAAYLVFLCIGSLNCLLDPLVYYFGSSQCQRQLSRALRCEKISERGSITTSSSDSCRSSRRRILKSGHTESSKLNTSVTKMDSVQNNLSSQYKKLLV